MDGVSAGRVACGSGVGGVPITSLLSGRAPSNDSTLIFDGSRGNPSGPAGGGENVNGEEGGGRGGPPAMLGGV